METCSVILRELILAVEIGVDAEVEMVSMRIAQIFAKEGHPAKNAPVFLVSVLIFVR
jgi:hypothetical protein